MDSELQATRSRIDKAKGHRQNILITKDAFEYDIKHLKRNQRNVDQAQVILQTLAKETQDGIKYHITDIVNLALNAVFDDPYEFTIEFVFKNNKVAAELYFIKDGNKIDPLSSTGGGVVDIAAFALRIALWTLGNPRSDNCIVLDEPLKWISKDLRPKAAEIIKELSNKLDLQFIIVTHMPELTEFADKIFEVRLRNGVSEVTCT